MAQKEETEGLIKALYAVKCNGGIWNMKSMQETPKRCKAIFYGTVVKYDSQLMQKNSEQLCKNASLVIVTVSKSIKCLLVQKKEKKKKHTYFFTWL